MESYQENIQIQKYGQQGSAVTAASTIQILIGPGVYSANGSFVDIAITSAATIGMVYCRSDCFPLLTNAQVQVDGKNRLITQCLAADQKCFYNDHLYLQNQDRQLFIAGDGTSNNTVNDTTSLNKQFWKSIGTAGITGTAAQCAGNVRYNFSHFFPFLVSDKFEVKNQCLIQLSMYAPTETFLGVTAVATYPNNIITVVAGVNLTFSVYMKQLVGHPPLDEMVLSCYEQILQTGTGINISYNTNNRKLISQNLFVKTTGSHNGNDFDQSVNTTAHTKLYATKVVRNGYQLCISDSLEEQNSMFDALRKYNNNQQSPFTTVQGEFMNSQIQNNITTNSSCDVGCGFLYLQL